MTQQFNQGGLILSTGALVPAPFIVDQDRPYRLSRTLPPRAVNLNEPRLLSRWTPPGWDSTIDARVPDLWAYYQGGIGSCAQVSTSMAAAIARVIGGPMPTEIRGTHYGWKYEYVRKLRGYWPRDDGSYVADGFDLEMSGCPAMDLHQYIDRADFDYPDSMDTQRTEDYVLGHRPFYPAEGGFIENVWSALDASEPVVFSSAWPDAWFSPQDGRVAEGQTPANASGAHAYCCWGIAPGWFLCDNSWSPQWSVDAPNFGFDMRPGSFAVPWSAVQSGLVYEGRSATFEPIVPVPDPEPSPPFDGCATEVQAAHDTDEGIVLRVRSQYRTQTARNALAKAAQQIHNQG
jgi:hypothetical protein